MVSTFIDNIMLSVGALVTYLAEGLGYGLDESTFDSQQWKRFFILQNVQIGPGVHPAS
jgi:hypothetical protein